MEKTQLKVFGIICLLSVILLTATFWTNAFEAPSPYWVQSIGYFILTYLCLRIYADGKSNSGIWRVVGAVILGQLIIQVPSRCIDWWGAFGSLMIWVSCILAVLLAVVCYKDNRSYTFILSYIIMVLFNTFVPERWNDYWASMQY